VETKSSLIALSVFEMSVWAFIGAFAEMAGEAFSWLYAVGDWKLDNKALRNHIDQLGRVVQNLLEPWSSQIATNRRWILHVFYDPN
jgi:hypothetical protein